jgi:hypothetical protein
VPQNRCFLPYFVAYWQPNGSQILVAVKVKTEEAFDPSARPINQHSFRNMIRRGAKLCALHLIGDYWQEYCNLSECPHRNPEENPVLQTRMQEENWRLCFPWQSARPLTEDKTDA